MKLLLQQHHSLRNALENAIEQLRDQPLAFQFLRATLSEILLKMDRQAIEVKPKYSLTLRVSEEYALVLAKQMELFDTNTYQRITTGKILTELQQRIG